MRLTHTNSVYYLESTYEERAIAKAAGFLWHGGGCRSGCSACVAGLGKVWWTRKAEFAANLSSHADAAAKQALTDAGANATATSSLVAESRSTESKIDVPAPEGLAYLPYQLAGISYVSKRDGVLLGDEMGLGKTIQVLGAINADPALRRILVVCPATLRLNWLREAERWLVSRRRIVVVERAQDVPRDDNVVAIVNYDRIRSRPMHVALMSQRWDLIVADEAHYVKNSRSQRTRALLGARSRRGVASTEGLVHRARKRVFLTGTPLPNRPVELHPVLASLVPAEFESFWKFAKRYCNARWNGYGWDVSGASNLDELQSRMRATCMVRRLKSDVLADLPPKRRQIIDIAQSDAAEVVAAERRAFESHEIEIESARAERDAALSLGDDEAYAAAVSRLKEATSFAFSEISEQRHRVAVAKAPHVADHVAGMLDDGVSKVVVMAHHRDVIEIIRERLSDYGAVVLTGETSMRERQSAVDEFQRPDGPRAFIGSITAAGVGITLTAASTVVFAELDWVPGNVTQAEDRCHRIGQAESVLVLHVVFDGSLDARMVRTIVEKQDVADRALDRTTAIETLDEQISRASRSRREEPHITEEMRIAAAKAMMILAGQCDGARARDGCGFNKNHAEFGLRLANLGAEMTTMQVLAACRLARFYRRQLPDDVVSAVSR